MCLVPRLTVDQTADIGSSDGRRAEARTSACADEQHLSESRTPSTNVMGAISRCSSFSMDKKSETFSSIVEAIQAMRRQEDYYYNSTLADYLDRVEESELNMSTSWLVNSEGRSPAHKPVDSSYRERMVRWCFDVVQHARFRRETVAVAVNCLDRYLSSDSQESHAILQDRKRFQLITMTCLHLAIKVHEPENLEPRVWAGLTRGAYTETDITETERHLLTELNWRLCPPTIHGFLHHFLHLFKLSDDMELQAKVVSQVELAIGDKSLYTFPSSAIAFAVFTNAMSGREGVCDTGSLLSLLEPSCDINCVQRRLSELLQNSRREGRGRQLAKTERNTTTVSVKERPSEGKSPRGVDMTSSP